MAGLYLHIPFCKQACHYCDFHFSTRPDFRAEVIAAMSSELQLQKDYLDKEEISTLYFGGGTPSLLQPHELEAILESIHAYYPVKNSAEVTLEANPDDLTEDRLSHVKKLGVNRLSIGIQSFDDEVLNFLNRAHDSREARRSITLARTQGFSNLSVDLILCYPGANAFHVEEEYRTSPGILTRTYFAYALTIEKKTAFGRWKEKGTLVPVAEEPCRRTV